MLIKIAFLISYLFMQDHFINVPAAERNEQLNYFTGTYANALKEAKINNKLVFIDAYTHWCGWCKKLNKTTFKDSSVVEYMNEHFVILKMNMESGEGPYIGKKYEVLSYPTLLFLKPDGNEVTRIEGYVNGEEFLKFAKIAVKKK